MIHRTARFVSVAALMGACLAPATQAQSAPALVDQLRAKAVPRFSKRASPRPTAASSPWPMPAMRRRPSALFMWHYGTALFGRDWDVTQEQLTAWAALVGRRPCCRHAITRALR